MKNDKNPVRDLKIIRNFMKEKKIFLEALSKEMKYSAPHVRKVFSGCLPITQKFMEKVLKALQRILQKDLQDFYKLMRNKRWTTFNWSASIKKNGIQGVSDAATNTRTVTTLSECNKNSTHR